MQLCRINAEDNPNKRELDLAFEVDKLRNHATHLESHNQVDNFGFLIEKGKK